MTGGKGNQSNAARILDDPANFLHSIDVERDRAFFLHTDQQSLRDASFVDGRTPLSFKGVVSERLSEVKPPQNRPDDAERYLFNCSFCGSTLLARLLDVPDRSLVLKEPRCLTDIAGWKILKTREGLPTERLGPALDLARAALRREFKQGERVTVKVASQGNILLDTLVENGVRMRPVFITISRLQFLRAIFRGGVERMHYAARIAWHMATDVPNGDVLLREAVGAGPDPLRKAANLAILARFLQVGAFQRAARAGGWNDCHVIDYDMIARSPEEATRKAAIALGLKLTDNDIERNVARLASRYSKDPCQSFSLERQERNDGPLNSENRQVFEDALVWAEGALGPQREVVD